MKKYLYTLVALFLLFPLMANNTPKAHKKQIKKHRKAYKKKFLKSERSPLTKKDLKYLRFYDADFQYKVQGKFKLTPDAKPFEMPTYSGRFHRYVKYGELTFILKGEQITLAVYRNLRLFRMPQYRDYLFIPFKDLTNNETTYGGGRYMDVKTTDIVTGEMIIDFNKCYNPYCAFSDGFNCPIPPDENHLKIKVEAGEKMFAKKK